MKTVKVSDDNWEKLFSLRVKLRKKSIDAVIKELLKGARK